MEGVASAVIATGGGNGAVAYLETAMSNYRNTRLGYTALATSEEASIGMGTLETSMGIIGEAGFIAGNLN